jgi:CRISPR-associated protein Cas1
MDRHLLPRVSDDIGHLYVEHARVDREDGALVIWDQKGKTNVPAASLTVLLLGPGTTVTHAAVLLACEVDLLISWVGEGEERFYATGAADRKSANLLHQARIWADPARRLDVVRRMYALRFGETMDTAIDNLDALRGREGQRVRAAYEEAAAMTGVAWDHRTIRTTWEEADTANRALSSASVALYGVVHSAVIAGGYSPAIGFIHTGSSRSFIFDIADLYKAEITIPTAFIVAADGEHDIERRTRTACRTAFRHAKLLDRILPNIKAVLGPTMHPDQESHLWTPGEAEQ